MSKGDDTRNHSNRKVSREAMQNKKMPLPSSADDPSYQTPEGEEGHYGDQFQPKRKGTGNILVDPVGNQWSNSTNPKDWNWD
jgi:hypothetical protein